MDEGAFLQDLALLMAVAGFVSLVFARLKWPKVLGYILAGVLLSRFTWGRSILADESSVKTAGQMGILFLMFCMGLGLSTSKLKKVGNVAMPSALLDTIVMMWLGFTIGRSVFGWPMVPSLFLGAAICDSATTILVKVVDEMGWSDRPFVKYALGTSVCEDVLCVGIIALISGVANGGAMNIAAAARSLGGLGVFFVATFFFGLVLIPRFLTSIAKRGDDEALLITLLGFAFLVTYIAYRLEFSLALGAFLIGVIGAGSEVRARLSRLVEPLRNMFAAMFFVSVGLLVNVRECWANIWAISGISLLVIAGKTFNCTLGALATGLDVKMSVQMGFSLAQIGEFAYMVALLYVSITGDMSKPMYQIAVGVSLLTTLASPLMIRFSDSVGDFAEKKCPARLKNALAAYSRLLSHSRTSAASSRRALVRRQIFQIATGGVLAFAVALAFSILETIDWSGFSVFLDSHKRLFLCLLVNVILIGTLTLVFRIGWSLSNSVAELVLGPRRSRWQEAMRPLVRYVVMSIVILLAFIEFVMINVSLAPEETWARIVIAVVLLAMAGFGWRFFVRIGRRVVKNFVNAIKTDEKLAKISREVTYMLPEGVISEVKIPDSSPAADATVGSLGIRAKTGVSVLAVDRRGKRIRNIGPSLELRAGDILIVQGDQGQVAQLKQLLEG